MDLSPENNRHEESNTSAVQLEQSPSKIGSLQLSVQKGVSLLNFNPNGNRNSFLTSPRSIEACKCLGIEECELLVQKPGLITQEEIPVQFKDNIQEFLKIKAQFLEYQRRRRVKQCVEMREDLELAEKMANTSPERSIYKNSINSAMLGHESKDQIWTSENEKRLEYWRKKQEMDIETSVEHGNQLLQIHRRVESSVQRILEKEKEHKLKFEYKKKATSDLRANWTKNKAEEEAKREEYRERSEEKRREQERKWKERQEDYFRHKREELSLKEAKRISKSRDVRTKVEEDERKRQETADQKKRIMQEKLAYAERKSEEKRAKILEKAEKEKTKLQQKLTLILQSQEEQKNRMWQKYSDRMKKSEENKQKYDKEKQFTIDFKRVKGLLKVREASNSFTIKHSSAVTRWTEINDKPDDVREYMQKLITEQKILKQMSLRDTGLDIRIQEKLQREAEVQEAKKKAIAQNLEASTLRAVTNKAKILDQRKSTQIVAYLKQEEAKIHALRKEKAEKYWISQTGEKVRGKEQRVQERIRLKDIMIQENITKARQFELEKAKLKKEFVRISVQVDNEIVKSLKSANIDKSTYQGSNSPTTNFTGISGRCTPNLNEINGRSPYISGKVYIRSSSVLKKRNATTTNDGYSTPGVDSREKSDILSIRPTSVSAIQSIVDPRKRRMRQSIDPNAGKRPSYSDYQNRSLSFPNKQSEFSPDLGNMTSTASEVWLVQEIQTAPTPNILEQNYVQVMSGLLEDKTNNLAPYRQLQNKNFLEQAELEIESLSKNQGSIEEAAEKLLSLAKIQYEQIGRNMQTIDFLCLREDAELQNPEQDADIKEYNL